MTWPKLPPTEHPIVSYIWDLIGDHLSDVPADADLPTLLANVEAAMRAAADAQTAAATAQSTADGAATSAEQAQIDATNAGTAAGQAQTSAQSAQQSASSATTSAASAESAASNAQNMASNAASMAQSAAAKLVPSVGVATLPTLALLATVDLTFTFNQPQGATTYQWAVLTQPPLAPTGVSFTEKSRTAAKLVLTAKALAAVSSSSPVVVMAWPVQ